MFSDVFGCMTPIPKYPDKGSLPPGIDAESECNASEECSFTFCCDDGRFGLRNNLISILRDTDDVSPNGGVVNVNVSQFLSPLAAADPSSTLV